MCACVSMSICIYTYGATTLLLSHSSLASSVSSFTSPQPPTHTSWRPLVKSALQLLSKRYR